MIRRFAITFGAAALLVVAGAAPSVLAAQHTVHAVASFPEYVQVSQPFRALDPGRLPVAADGTSG
jgi:hypothetical protein